MSEARKADLRKGPIEAWLGRLPDDVRSAVPGEGDESAALAAMAALGAVGSSGDVLAAVEGAEDSFVAMGRARRLRFLAWFVGGPYSDPGAMLVLTGEGGEGEGGRDGSGALGKVAPLFASDVRALVEALGPRAARMVVDGDTLAAVTGAGFEVASEMEMRQGGGR